MLLILLVFAFVFFAVAAVLSRRPEPISGYWSTFVAAGLAFWVLTQILAATGMATK